MADQYFLVGEMSDVLVHQIVTDGIADGRPTIVFCFTDADPSGWQMPISIARKVQAFTFVYPDMPPIQVRRAALTPAQVHWYNDTDDTPLPVTPLKAGEGRGEEVACDVLGFRRPRSTRGHCTRTRSLPSPVRRWRRSSTTRSTSACRRCT